MPYDSLPVTVHGWPLSANLLLWGRAATGWWGCIVWQQTVAADGVDTKLKFAAWIPAERISRTSMSPEKRLPRIELPDDPHHWPAPPGWPFWYAGCWLEGPVISPPGLELVNEAAWRRRDQTRYDF